MGSSSEIEEILDSVDKKFIAFKNFDICDYPPNDHHFINKGLMDRQPHFLCRSCKSKANNDQIIQFQMRMEQEWEILSTSLPKSMYVRTYKGGIDFMRVVIIGLEGTLYAYGLFFFDIFFPKEYPSKPPLVFQYHNRKLLDFDTTTTNTTPSSFNNGSRFVWDPLTSNVHKTLEFIQRYILRTFRVYDSEDIEKDFMFSHFAMLNVLGSPPREFEDLVRGHFRKSSHNILMKFRSEGNLGESEMRIELYFKLLKAFEINGSYCKHLAHGINKVETSSSNASKQQYYTIDGTSSSTNTWLRTFVKNFMRGFSS